MVILAFVGNANWYGDLPMNCELRDKLYGDPLIINFLVNNLGNLCYSSGFDSDIGFKDVGKPSVWESLIPLHMLPIE